MKVVIIIRKTRKKEKLFEVIANTTTLAEMAWASSAVDLARRYMYAMSNADLNTAKKQGSTGIKKYWRRIV